MNTDDFNNHQKKIELLALARQQLSNELLKSKNDAHIGWQRENEAAWLTNGKLLPYPSTVPVYPTEQQVVARALELYNKQQPASNTLTSVPEPIREASPWQTYLAPEPEIVKPVLQVVEEPKVEQEVETPAEPINELEEPSEDASLKNLISKFLTLARELDANKENKNV
jgi:hypothetical protein